MPHAVVGRINDALNQQEKAINGSTILVLGVAYKRDIDDIRESPALDVMTLLHQKGARVQYSDPYVPQLAANAWHASGDVPGDMTSEALTAAALSKADCVVILTDHRVVDYAMVQRTARVVVDTRNAIKGQHCNVFKLGAPAPVPDAEPTEAVA